jgi:hypothetical protein
MALMMVQDKSDIVPLKKRYIRSIHKVGFTLAHREILAEIKRWLDYDANFSAEPSEALHEAVRLHTRLVFMAAFSKCQLPPVAEIDRLFVEVFGEFSLSILNQAGQRVL